MKNLLAAFALLISVCATAQVTVQVDFSKSSHTVSPYLYGRNNSLSDDPKKPLTTADWTRLKDSGVRFLRESGGNNCTKYNWRLKISSHPDWYNNVYAHDWDFAAGSFHQKLPLAQGMWAFQLIGKSAMTTTANFNDWGYNSSQWWDGVNQNLAGGGTVNASGGNKALVEGNPNLYLENWTEDSTTAILDHWFNDLSLDKNSLRYWNMDNEVEIWNGTHDDVMPTQLSAEQFMQRYFAVAKKAREKYPDIKLVGPVTANEWQWYNWPSVISSGGKTYPWLEYFIKRVGEEEAASGIRLLDVLDIHFYPDSTTTSDVVQYHRVFFDKDYEFPEANGVKNVSGTWNANEKKEYIFERCKTWLTTYLGADHGVTLGLTETGIPNINANTSAIWYAGMLGEFMKHEEVEIFTPWTWQVGMWEVLHLFSYYNHEKFIPATSSDEVNVSAYPTVNATRDSLTVVLVNRSSVSKNVSLSFNGFTLADMAFPTHKLGNLSSSETFKSHSSNALQHSTIAKSGNAISVAVPSMSIISLQLKGQIGDVVTAAEHGVVKEDLFQIFPNPVVTDAVIHYVINGNGPAAIELVDMNGKQIRMLFNGEAHASVHQEADLTGVDKGVYILRLKLNNATVRRKIVINE